MTITEILDQLYDEIDEEGITLSDFSIMDDEDLQVFALRYLMDHLKEAFDEIEFDDEDLELTAL